MSRLRKPRICITPIRMHSVSALQILENTTNFSSLQPSVRIRPLHLHSAVSVCVPSISISKCFNNGPKVILSPLKSAISNSSYRKVLSLKTRRLYPNITKCDTKRCLCCKHISCKSTIKSSVNSRTFNVKLSVDVDCKSTNIIYVLT